MKNPRNFAIALAGTLMLSLVAAGCASTSPAQLASSNDKPGAIKKLAKMLIKDSTDQEAADVFDEMYNQEISNLLAKTAVTNAQLRSEFAKKQNAADVKEALSKIASQMEGRAQANNKQTILTNSAVNDMVYKLSTIRDAYMDLTNIQKAVADMPGTIGLDPEYDVKKYTENWDSAWTKASDDLGEFYCECADAMLPAVNYDDFKRIISVYEKGSTATMTYSKVVGIKQTIAYLYDKEGDKYLGEAKESLKNANKETGSSKNLSLTLVSLQGTNAMICYEQALSYNKSQKGTADKLKEANYVIGDSLLTAYEEGFTDDVKNLKTALECFKDAKDFKDASEKAAKTQSLIDDAK